MRASRRLLVAAAALAALASSAFAVDVTGRWLVTDENSLIGTSQYLLDVTQAGTSLTITYLYVGGGTYTGSIDPVTGAFTYHIPSAQSPFPFPECSGTTFSGTVVEDGQSFSGTYAGEFFKTTPPFVGCFGFSGGFSGLPSHCGDGVVDLGEECDDGNNSEGDCCYPLCQTVPAGYGCPGGVCDGAGTCAPAATTTTSSSTTTSTTTTTHTTLPACPDPQAMAVIRAEADASCTQAGRGCVGALSHRQYVGCIRDEARNAVAAHQLPVGCLRPLVRCAARSTCARPGFVTCCRTRASGKTTCALEASAAKCRAPRRGGACVGSFVSCCDACGTGGCASGH